MPFVKLLGDDKESSRDAKFGRKFKMGEYYALILKSESLEHHGVKGMKWGVRRYEKLKAKRRRAFGKVESYDEIISENKGSHPNKWDRKRDKAVKKANKLLSKEKALGAKLRYKDEKRSLNKASRELARNLFKEEKKSKKQAKKEIRSAKKLYKKGQIDKETYKDIKQLSKLNKEETNYDREISTAGKAYELIKQKRFDKLKLKEALHGKNSWSYKRGLNAYNKIEEKWGAGGRTYKIKKLNGKYRVTREEYYFY